MSASGDWGPAPLGVDLTQTQDASVIGSVVANTALAVAAVGLRLFARISRHGPGLGSDDYFILLALLLCLGNAVCCLISVPWGGGKHFWALTIDQFTRLFQTTYAFVIVYISCVSATKVSILLYYRRAFGTSIVYYIVFAFAILHWLEVTVTWLAGCNPISYYWRQYTDPTAVGHCINAPIFFLVNGCIGMLIDVAILLVPIPTVYKLRMPLRKKMLVCGILLLGSFVCVASAVRIVMINQLVGANDISWAMSRVFVWSCCEPSVGIICACLPTYAPLVRGWLSFGGHHGPSGRQYYFRESSVGGESFEKRQDNTTVVDDEVELAVHVSSGGQSELPGTRDGCPNANWDTDIMVKKEFTVTSTL